MEKKNVVFLTVLAIATLLTAVVGTTFAYFTATVSNKTAPTTTTVTTAGSLGVEYDDGEQINLNPILPGASATKTFTVENTGDESAKYTISWDTSGFANGFVTNGVCTVASETTEEDCTSASGEWTTYQDFVYSITKNGTSMITSGTVNTRVYPNTITDSRAYSKTNGKAQIGASGTEYFVKAMPRTGGEELVGEQTIASGSTDTYVLTVYYLETGVVQNENAGGKTFTGKLKANLVTQAGVEIQP